MVDAWYMYLVGPLAIVFTMLFGMVILNAVITIIIRRLPRHLLNALDDITKRSKD